MVIHAFLKIYQNFITKMIIVFSPSVLICLIICSITSEGILGHDHNRSHFQLAFEQSFGFFKDIPEKQWRLKKNIHCAAAVRDMQEGRDISSTGIK